MIPSKPALADWYPSSDPNATVSQTRDATHVQSSANALHLAVTSTTFPATDPFMNMAMIFPYLLARLMARTFILKDHISEPGPNFGIILRFSFGMVAHI